MRHIFFVITFLCCCMLCLANENRSAINKNLAAVFPGERFLSKHEIKLPSQKTTVLLAFYYSESHGGVRPAIIAEGKHITSFYNFYKFDQDKPINAVVMDIDNDMKDDIVLKQNGNFAILRRWKNGFFPGRFFIAKDQHVTRELRDIDGDKIYEVVETHGKRFGDNGKSIIEIYRLDGNYFVRDKRIPEQFRTVSEIFLRQSYNRMKSLDFQELDHLDEKTLDLKTLDLHYIYNKKPPVGRGKSIYRADFEVKAQIERLYCGCNHSLAVDCYRFAITEANICVTFFPGGVNASTPFVRGNNKKLNELTCRIMKEEFNKFKSKVLAICKSSAEKQYE